MKEKQNGKKFNFDDTLKRVQKILANHPRKDAEFRMNIAFSQLGDICRYITHDKKLCLGVRPYGVKSDEEDAFGHALAQLLVAAKIRNIDIKKAVSGALDGMEDKEWKKRQGKLKEGRLQGIVAHPGKISGTAFVDPQGRRLDYLNGQILVIENIRADNVTHLKKIRGIITNDGGKFSHAAILAREFDIPCVVGTGNATKIIDHGQKVTIQAEQDKIGIVHLI